MSQQSVAGISTLRDGSRIIVTSKRSDGSERKERKIRPGFTPAEDVCHYQNSQVALYRERLNAPKPGDNNYVPPGAPQRIEEVTKKKKRSRGKKKSEQDIIEEDVYTKPLPANESTLGVTQDEMKKARNLRKKIRQVEELKAKRDAGETLIPEQLSKLNQLEKLQEELSTLGL